MSVYLVRLIEKRLDVLSQRAEVLRAVIDERPLQKYGELRERFNNSRNIREKSLLAGRMKTLLKRAETWTQRMNKAHDELLEIRLESDDLAIHLFIARSRAGRCA